MRNACVENSQKSIIIIIIIIIINNNNNNNNNKYENQWKRKVFRPCQGIKGCPRGVVVKAMDYGIEVSEFEL